MTTTDILLADMGYCIIGEHPGGVNIQYLPGGGYYDSTGVAQIGSAKGESVFQAELRHDFIVTQNVAVGKIDTVTWGA
jgi:hypothetical protein